MDRKVKAFLGSPQGKEKMEDLDAQGTRE